MNYNRIEDPGPPEKYLKKYDTVINPQNVDASSYSSVNTNQRIIKDIVGIKSRLSNLEKKTEEILEILKAGN